MSEVFLPQETDEAIRELEARYPTAAVDEFSDSLLRSFRLRGAKFEDGSQPDCAIAINKDRLTLLFFRWTGDTASVDHEATIYRDDHNWAERLEWFRKRAKENVAMGAAEGEEADE